MKTAKIGFILLIGSLFAGSTVFGQKFYENPKYGPDSISRVQCAQQLSIMSQFVKTKSYEYALDAWRYTFKNCPEASKNVYIHGSKIIRDQVEKAADEATKLAWVDTLMILYQTRIDVYKDRDPGKIYGMKGGDLIRYNPAAIEEAYGYLKKSIELKGDKFSESVAVTYISTTNAMLQQGLIGPDVMITNYIEIMDLFDQKIASGKSGNKIESAMESIEKTFAESGAADCESLIAIFAPKYAETPNDIEFLKKVTTLLSETDCEDSELYAQTAEALFKQEPSADAAAKLAGLFAVKENFTKAKEYYNTAIEQQTDSKFKAQYYLQLGRIAFKESNYPTCRKHCQAAIGLKSDLGDAYILIGDAYVSSKASCGSNDFEKSAVYWVAVDKYIKAKSVDPSVAEKASEKIKLYSQYFPNNEVAFFNDAIEGKPYTVGCWINETTTVRTTK